MVLQKGNQDSGAYPVHACLQEPGLLLSQSFFIPDFLLGERKLLCLGLESGYCGMAICLCFIESCGPGTARRD